eukprot:650588_1
MEMFVYDVFEAFDKADAASNHNAGNETEHKPIELPVPCLTPIAFKWIVLYWNNGLDQIDFSSLQRKRQTKKHSRMQTNGYGTEYPGHSIHFSYGLCFVVRLLRVLSYF